MTRLTVVYWRGIPAQVIAEIGRGRRRRRASVALPERFARAIDAAAMRSGETDADSYLADWRRSEPMACDDGDPESAARAEAGRLAAAYDDARLAILVGNGGVPDA